MVIRERSITVDHILSPSQTNEEPQLHPSNPTSVTYFFTKKSSCGPFSDGGPRYWSSPWQARPSKAPLEEDANRMETAGKVWIVLTVPALTENVWPESFMT